jgi:hypothetical protein
MLRSEAASNPNDKQLIELIGELSTQSDEFRTRWAVLTCVWQSGHLPAETARTSTSFTIFDGTSEIQNMIIGRAVTGLNVR